MKIMSSSGNWTTRYCFSIVLAIAACQIASAQEAGDTTLSDVVVEQWEFGLEISSPGNASGIVASVPVPIEWPEQKITVIEEKKSDAVRRMSYKKIGDTANQMVIKINRLRPGETARCSVILEIEKSMIVEPASTAGLRFATKQETRRLNKYLKPSPYIESNHRRIKALADSIELDESATAWDQVHTIFDWVRDNIEYEFDVTIRTCLQALDREKGDCEELSSLFIAICRAKGIPARAVWIPDHTYPEFYLVDEQGEGQWYPCQAAGKYEFGSMTETKPILHKGDKFKVSGHPKEIRYVMPTLMAQDAQGQPTMKWIMRKIED